MTDGEVRYWCAVALYEWDQGWRNGGHRWTRAVLGPRLIYELRRPEGPVVDIDGTVG